MSHLPAQELHLGKAHHFSLRVGKQDVDVRIPLVPNPDILLSCEGLHSTTVNPFKKKIVLTILAPNEDFFLPCVGYRLILQKMLRLLLLLLTRYSFVI